MKALCLLLALLKMTDLEPKPEIEPEIPRIQIEIARRNYQFITAV